MSGLRMSSSEVERQKQPPETADKCSQEKTGPTAAVTVANAGGLLAASKKVKPGPEQVRKEPVTTTAASHGGDDVGEDPGHAPGG